MDADSTRAAVVDRQYHWAPITAATPRGSKMQLINRDAGVAVYRELQAGDNFWTHCAPLPTFDPEERYETHPDPNLLATKEPHELTPHAD